MIKSPFPKLANNQLAQHHCVPCEGGTAPLTRTEEDTYFVATPEWVAKREGVHQRFYSGRKD